ncbi:MAG: hypothetical protein QM765_25785 [Myxococcales bacterium]
MKYALVLVAMAWWQQGTTTAEPCRSTAGQGRRGRVEQCNRLLLHLVDLESRGPASWPEDPTGCRRLKRTEFQADIRDKTPAHRVECALAARNLDGVTKCDEAP